MRKLTKKAFREWLEGFRTRQVVGYPDRYKECPLARFSGMDVHYGYLSGPSGKRINMPRWALNFAERIDDNVNRHVTAARALKILEEC